MSLVTQEADPGDGEESDYPPTPSSASSINDTGVIYYPRQSRALLLATPSKQLSRKIVTIHHSGKMLDKNPTDTLKTVL